MEENRKVYILNIYILRLGRLQIEIWRRLNSYEFSQVMALITKPIFVSMIHATALLVWFLAKDFNDALHGL